MAEPGNISGRRPSGRESQARRTSGSSPWRGPRWIYIGVGLAVVALIGIALFSILGASLLPDGGPSRVVNLGDPSDRAPAFSLPDQHGQTYTLTPGDGKNHLIVFYMGYF